MTGGKLVLLLTLAVKNKDNNPLVTLDVVYIYTVLGRGFKVGRRDFPASADELFWGEWYWALCTKVGMTYRSLLYLHHPR